MSDAFDLDGLLQQALAVQQQLTAAQAGAAASEVQGSAGGGSVTVTMTGAGEVTAIRIAREVIDPDERELLEDLVLAALRDASTRAADLQAGAISGMGALSGLPDMSQLLGLAGGAGAGGAGSGAAGGGGEGGSSCGGSGSDAGGADQPER